MNILDTRDLRIKRDELLDDIINAFNDKFDADIDSIEDIDYFLDDEDNNITEEELSAFLKVWDDEYKLIEEINDIEDTIGSQFKHGVDLIPADDFEEYTEEYVRGCGYISDDFPSWIEIDWSATANNISSDYSSIEYDGDDYYYMG